MPSMDNLLSRMKVIAILNNDTPKLIVLPKSVGNVAKVSRALCHDHNVIHALLMLKSTSARGLPSFVERHLKPIKVDNGQICVYNA